MNLAQYNYKVRHFFLFILDCLGLLGWFGRVLRKIEDCMIKMITAADAGGFSKTTDGVAYPLDERVYILNGGERLWCKHETRKPGFIAVELLTPGYRRLRYLVAYPDGILFDEQDNRTDSTVNDLEYVGCIYVEPEYDTAHQGRKATT